MWLSLSHTSVWNSQCRCKGFILLIFVALPLPTPSSGPTHPEQFLAVSILEIQFAFFSVKMAFLLHPKVTRTHHILHGWMLIPQISCFSFTTHSGPLASSHLESPHSSHFLPPELSFAGKETFYPNLSWKCNILACSRFLPSHSPIRVRRHICFFEEAKHTLHSLLS